MKKNENFCRLARFFFFSSFQTQYEIAYVSAKQYERINKTEL